ARRVCSISLPISVLLPTPPLPVMATTRLLSCAGPSAARISPTCSPRARKLSKRARARRSWRRKRSRSGSSMAGPADAWGLVLEKGNDVGQRRAGTENARHAHGQQLGHIAFRHDAADQDADVFEAGFAQELQHAWHQRHMRPTEEAQSEPVRVFIGN